MIKIPGNRKSFYKYFVGLMSISCLIFVVNNYGISNVARYIPSVPLQIVLMAFFLITTNMLLSSLRYHILLKRLGILQPLSKSFHDNTVSIVCGMVAFNFFGQGFSRSLIQSKFDWGPSVGFLTTGIERISTLLVMTLFASGGVLWLFQSISFDHTKGSYVILALFYLAAVGAGVYWFGLRKSDRRSIRKTVRNNIVLSLEITLISFFMIVLMASAYFIIARSLAENASVLDLTAMAGIVMFISSIPISFAGWGVRELSAGYVFSAIGQSSEAGVTLGILIGILSIVAIFSLALMLMVTKKYPITQQSSISSARNISSNGLIGAMYYTIPVTVAVAMLFQMRLPAGAGELNINLADPVVIIGSLIVLFHLIKSNSWKRLFWSNWFAPSLLLASVIVFLGFLKGWVHYGVIIEWALYNRLIGWLVVLAYFLSGMMIHLNGNPEDVKLMVRVFLAACVSIVSVNIFLLITSDSLIDNFWVYSGIYGMAGNPNAFGYQLLVALAIGLSSGSLWHRRRFVEIEWMALGMVIAGIYFSQSRTSVMCMICLIFAYLCMGVPLKRIATMTAIALAVIISVYAGRQILFSSFDLGATASIDRLIMPEQIKDVQSDRALNMKEAFRMWQEHWLVGAGLGAFVYEQIKDRGDYLVIHSTYLWWLAEFGIIGFLSFLAIPISLFHGIWKHRHTAAPWAKHGIIGLLIVMGVTSLLHEMAYQRAFWFFLGLTATNYNFFMTSKRSESVVF